jgi:hypothetical protein
MMKAEKNVRYDILDISEDELCALHTAVSTVKNTDVKANLKIKGITYTTAEVADLLDEVYNVLDNTEVH